jgi:hypothetical protein
LIYLRYGDKNTALEVFFAKSQEKYDPFSDKEIVISFPDSAFDDDADNVIPDKDNARAIKEQKSSRKK